MTTGKRFGKLKKEPKKLLEKDIQKLITKYLELRRIPFAVTNAERVWNPQGFVRKSKMDWFGTGHLGLLYSIICI